MRYLFYFSLFFISFNLYSQINPFTLLSLQSRAMSSDSRSVLLPVDTDCIERPHFHGALTVHAEIDRVFYGYSNRCYWEAYRDVSTQSFPGASLVVIADWRPLLALPQEQEDAGAICRKKPLISKSQMSYPWLEDDGTYANYGGCKYYSPLCTLPLCNMHSPLDYWPVAEADGVHLESTIVDSWVKPPPIDDAGWIQPPAPDYLQEGKYVDVSGLYEYYEYIFWHRCEYLREKYPDDNGFHEIKESSISPRMIICQMNMYVFNPRNEMPLRFFTESFHEKYYCYVGSLEYPNIADNVCFINDNYYVENNKIKECYLSNGVKRCGDNNGDNNNNNGGKDEYGADTNATVHRNEKAIADVRDAVMYNSWNIHELLDDSKRTHNSLDEILQVLKEGNDNGNGLNYNYHPDLKKFNDDLNKNHEELMNHLGSMEEGDLNKLKGKFDSELNNYNENSLSEIDGYLNSLFDSMPDLFVQFKLPNEFYGDGSGRCIPINKTYSLDFTQGISYDFKLNTSLTCEYYDDYFRKVMNFVFYFLTAIVCYRLYHRYMTTGF